MMIESDLIIAHFKKSDWLKKYADAIFDAVRRGILKVEVSTEIFHEVYYVLSEFTETSVIIKNFSYLMGLDGIEFLSPTPEVYIAALSLKEQYQLSSIFDAIYAAQLLIQSKDKTIISTEHIYDKIPGIKRIDPKDFCKMKGLS